MIKFSAEVMYVNPLEITRNATILTSGLIVIQREVSNVVKKFAKYVKSPIWHTKCSIPSRTVDVIIKECASGELSRNTARIFLSLSDNSTTLT